MQIALSCKHMMATSTAAAAAIVGLSAGKRGFGSDFSDKLSFGTSDFGFVCHHHVSWTWTTSAKKSSYYHNLDATRALREDVNYTTSDHASVLSEKEEEIYADDFSVEALHLLQKILLEKQWNLSTTTPIRPREKRSREMHITCSGVSARQRRIDAQRKSQSKSRSTMQLSASKQQSRSTISPELLKNRLKGYVKGSTSKELLTHSDVLLLSKMIEAGLHLEEQKSRLKEKFGREPTEEQLATSLSITRSEMQIKQIECYLAREKLAMSNVRFVISIAQKYENMGAELDDLVQAGLIGLLKGIEKFDSSKGFKFSTYLYWWIRQGIYRELARSSGTLRLPFYLHERLIKIRNAKAKLNSRGVTPSIDKIAEYLNISRKKVRNATEAVSRVFSLDRQAFPSLNGLSGETLHSYIADKCLDNNPWHGVDEAALKDEVNKLITTSLGPREGYIIRLYYGLDKECLTWEEISKRLGLSRERVRQVGLVAVEKLKHAAKKRRLDYMLVNY